MVLMRKLLPIFLAFVLLAAVFTAPVLAFDMTLTTAKKTFQLDQGESTSYSIGFRDDFASGRYRVHIRDFVYDTAGTKVFLEKDELADLGQSLTTWVTLPFETFEAKKGIETDLPVRVQVPTDAQHGDHFAVLMIEKIPEEDGGQGLVSVGGSVSSLLAVQVLGGDTLKAGELLDYRVTTQERARNTANFLLEFVNTGNVFFRALAEVAVFRDAADQEPIKVVARDFTVHPNIRREVNIPLGSLGEELAEGDYFSRLTVYEYSEEKKSAVLGTSEQRFQYFEPFDPELDERTIAREIDVSPTFVQVIEEFGWYILGFVLALGFLIRVLFFQSRSAKPAKKSRRKS